MAKRNTALDQPILESARKEFYEKGFEKASLKDICKNAGVTTGAVYKRYKDKEDLFSAVVQDTYNEIKQAAQVRIQVDVSSLSDREVLEAWNIKESSLLWWFRFLYERRENFILLISRAQNTRYADFHRSWIEQMTEQTYLFYEETFKRKLTQVTLRKKDIRTLLVGYWAMLHEPYIQDYSLEDMEIHCHYIYRLLNWHEVLQLQEKE